MAASRIAQHIRTLLPPDVTALLPKDDRSLWARIIQAFIVGFVILRILKSRFKQVPGKFKHCEEPPGLVSWAPLQLDVLYREIKAANAGRLTPNTWEMHDARGDTIRAHVLGGTATVTRDPENIKAILATQFQDFELGKRTEILGPLLGHGVFNSDGKAWEQSRALLRPQFAREQVADLENAENHLQPMFRAIDKGLEGGNGVDLQTIFARFTTDSATEFLFGESTYSQEAALSSTSVSETSFAVSFEGAQDYLVNRMRYGPVRWFLPSTKGMKDIKFCHEFVDQYVQKALAANVTPGDNTNKYIFSHVLAKATQDQIVIRDQLLNILLAGRDTTRSLLSWTIWCLARDPRVLGILQNTIFERFGTRPPTYVDLKEFTYLKYVLNEVLRLYPSVPHNVRFAKHDTTIPRGGGASGNSPVFVAAGTPVSYSVACLHRTASIYGEDVHKFRPERWAEKTIGRNWEYLPFNGGPRICLGQQYALTESGYVIVRFLQRYKEITLVDPTETEEGRFGISLTLMVAGGCNVRLAKH